MPRLFPIALVLLGVTVGCQDDFFNRDANARRGNLARAPVTGAENPPVGAQCQIQMAQPGVGHDRMIKGRIVKVTPNEVILANATEERWDSGRERSLLNDIPALGKQTGTSASVQTNDLGGKAIRVPKKDIAQLQVVTQPAANWPEGTDATGL
jgi:hypothetical protein